MSRPWASVLVPWRTDNGHRERVWNFLRPLWSNFPDIELCVGQDPFLDRPFSAARAFNDAAAQATGKVLVMMGADHVPSLLAVQEAAIHALAPPYWSPVFGKMGYLSEHDTLRLLQQPDEWIEWPRPERVENLSTGTLAIIRGAWGEVGGMDPRYEGWGYEDTAFRRTLQRQLGASRYESPWTGLELWHPTAHRDMSVQNPNRRLFESEH